MTEGINMLSIFSLAKSRSNNKFEEGTTGLIGNKRNFDESHIATSESESKEEMKKMKIEDEPLKSSVNQIDEN